LRLFSDFQCHLDCSLGCIKIVGQAIRSTCAVREETAFPRP
jgi:hypothetical protein